MLHATFQMVVLVDDTLVVVLAQGRAGRRVATNENKNVKRKEHTRRQPFTHQNLYRAGCSQHPLEFQGVS
jgi:hypothetical protein